MPPTLPEDRAGFPGSACFLRKQFIHDVNGGVAGGSYIWESLAAAKAFYNGPWLEGIRARYGCEPRVTYFETFAIADLATGYAGPPPGPLLTSNEDPTAAE